MPPRPSSRSMTYRPESAAPSTAAVTAPSSPRSEGLISPKHVLAARDERQEKRNDRVGWDEGTRKCEMPRPAATWSRAGIRPGQARLALGSSSGQPLD